MTRPSAEFPAPIPLWTGPAPLSRGHASGDIPTLTPFLPAATNRPTPAVVVCPGGGYVMLAMEHEGIHVARWFQARGVAAFVLQYRLATGGYRHPAPLLDAQRAIRLVRRHAAEWPIDPARVGLLGFSAGGHLTSTLATHFDAGDADATDPVDRESCRPDFAVPVYPVISLKKGVTNWDCVLSLLGPEPDPALIENLSNETQVTPQTPPTLLVHSADDSIVPVENSRLFYRALQKAGVPSAYHEYPCAPHGFGYGAQPDRSPPGWLDRVGDWLKAHGFIA